MKTSIYHRTKGSNGHQAKERFLGLKPKTLRDIAVVTVVVLGLSVMCVQARADGLPEGAYISPVPFMIGNLDASGLPILSPDQQTDWNTFIVAAIKLAPIYHYPVKVIIAQAALESGRGTSRMAKERHNYFGYACFDRDPEQYCARYDNAEQSIIAYLELVKNHYPQAYALRDNPDAMIQAIHDGGYATDANYVAKVTSTKEWGSL